VRRLFVLLLGAIGLFATSGIALADHGDVTRPGCADVRNVDFFYATTGEVSATIEPLEPSCRGITYTINVVVDPGDPNSAVVSASTRGTGASLVDVVTAPIADDDSIVCAYVTTSRGGPEGLNTVFDRAPTEGCVELLLGGSGSTGFH
jgi:hypothetical protein